LPGSARRSLARLPLAAILVVLASSAASAQRLGDVADVSREFQSTEHVYFIGQRVGQYDADTGAGTLEWARHRRTLGLSFNKLDLGFGAGESNEFPGTEYDKDPALPFEISFVTPRTVRVRLSTRTAPFPDDAESLMLAAAPPRDTSWTVDAGGDAVTYASAHGRVRLVRDPWHLEFYDASGRLLTRTMHLDDGGSFAQPVPFSFIRRASDLSRNIAAAFQLAPDEKLYGGGESFTRLNKRGQKVIAWVRDAMGAQTSWMYKPVPVFVSSAGYGMFVHTSAPVTFDFGHSFDRSNVIYSGDEFLDLFVFIGDPKDVLSEYTALTGRSPVPPLWSFGLWMSRITYKSEDEVRDVAAKLRQHRIPTDVIHLDTGWFETEWRNNYTFAPSRFRDPVGMIRDLRDQGFRISLWQLPYFTSKNEIYDEAVKAGYVVRNDGGRLPYEDAILDFSNDETVRWYQGLLAGLLKAGVGAIKVDFGEDAPARGVYASGRTGWYEHNLYPLRYNKAAADVTTEVTGESIIWARSAWAGSQRYPIHWGGDAENSYSAMAATLRAGLSLGMTGFTYWSHDAGGFVNRAPRELYRRWLAFSALTSHTRCHGAPPREPWEYDAAFVEDFRRTIEMRYALMPYLYAQSHAASTAGHPLLRPLFLEFPEDPTSWLVEDQYLLGTSLLVAPLFEETLERSVYLPPGAWIDYQTGREYRGGQWQRLVAGPVPVVVLARDGAVIPHVRVAQSTGAIDWTNVELRVFSARGSKAPATGLFALPGEDPVILEVPAGRWALARDPLPGRVKWRVTTPAPPGR
jgi:alpha-D-xyloside xylohydrolase